MIFEKGSNQTVYLVSFYPFQALRFFFGITVGIKGNQVIIVLFGDILHTPQKQGVKGVGDIRNDDCDRVGFLGSQAAGAQVGDVAQFLDNRQYALAGVSSGTEMVEVLLSTCDTVACETPARSATSYWVGRRLRNLSSAMLFSCKVKGGNTVIRISNSNYSEIITFVKWELLFLFYPLKRMYSGWAGCIAWGTRSLQIASMSSATIRPIFWRASGLAPAR